VPTTNGPDLPIGPGERAPRFSLRDESGRFVDVPSKDRATVLVFYRGDW
jgi:peroxiredoxin